MEYLLSHLLQNAAQSHPSRTAVRHLDTEWTYGELESLSNRLARTLKDAGVKKGDRVGLWLNKSLHSVCAIYGIMKAGGVYVPIDPHAPVSRAAYIARDCDLRVLIADDAHAGQVPAACQEGAPVQVVVCPDRDLSAEMVGWPGAAVLGRGEILARDSGSVESSAIENDLAYILYTSGSTGRPKGVMIAHRTCLTFVHWAFETFRLHPEDRMTSMAPLHFDLSTFDLYATAKAAAAVVLVPEKLASLPVKLADLWEEERITVTYMVPSILSLLVQYGRLDSHDLSALRLVLFAGEVFPLKYLRRLVKAVPGAEFFNLYGPTETNVCTYHQVRAKDLSEDAPPSLPIGRACENTEVFALDDAGNPISEPGVEGELWVRGPTVALGYWGDAEKTARSFRQNPLQDRFRDVAYATGDIVKLAGDGRTWLFLGRRDHMVKCRGYRIELGEVESVLYDHKAVKEAAVVAVPDELLGNRLLGFVVLTDNAQVTQGDLVAFCRNRLPPYMVPERIRILELLPKTSTGKVNRPELVGMAHATVQDSRGPGATTSGAGLA